MRRLSSAVAASVALLAGCGSPSTTGDGMLTVTRVVDGDTLFIAGESVRVIGIDTPETVHPSVPDECGGVEATNYAIRLVKGRKVRLVTDPSQGERDYYERRLAYVEIEGVGDFGTMMIKAGLAREYTYAKAYARQRTYKGLEVASKANGTGTWSACGGFDKPLR